MCGITGFISSKIFPQLKLSLLEAASRLTHRGPDDSGHFFDMGAGVGLAHRRLAVLDLSTAGRQPMTTEDGTIHIVHNGEIYNYRSLRDSLIKEGHTFKSATDTEVVLKAYQQWGIDCLSKFSGMFALAIWDERKNSLFLARDRLGIKPLYYHRNGDIFLFASELKALMAFQIFSKEIDPDALSLCLHYQYVPAPKTVFQNTYKLLPGRFARVSGRDITIRTFWKSPEPSNPKKPIRLNEINAMDRLDALLTEAVSDRLISDVPLGALLSGGIDSSLMVALMQKIGPAPVKTFTIGFTETAFNEAPWAAKIADCLKTEHTELYVTPKETMALIPKIPEIYDEPFADVSAVPTVLVSRLARSKVTVAISGDGGDEQFAGYVRYWMTLALENFLKKIPNSTQRHLASLFKRIPALWIERCYRPWKDVMPQRFSISNFQDKWQKFTHLLGEQSVQELYRMTICLWTQEEIQKLVGRAVPKSQYEETFDRLEKLPLLSQLMAVDLETYLPDAMLTKVDRASMAAGLEVRVPLLDHRVVEYTAMLPDFFKYKNGTGKYLLKKLLARYVPPELFQRPKTGFGVPIGEWFRSELKELLLDYLSAERLKQKGLFNPSFVEEKIKEHMSGRINHQYRLWSLLTWEMWHERWIGR